MLVKIINNKAIVTSKDVADTFGKYHRSVLKSIRDLDCSDEFREQCFMLSSYTSPQNKKLPCYEMTKDGFVFLCMGFTGDKSAQFKEAYIGSYNQMELSINEHSIQAPKSMEELNRVSKQIEELKEVGSFHGKGLASYKKKKIKIDETFKIALDTAQLVLNIK